MVKMVLYVLIYFFKKDCSNLLQHSVCVHVCVFFLLTEVSKLQCPITTTPPNKAACHDKFSLGDEGARNPLMEITQLKEMKDSRLVLPP